MAINGNPGGDKLIDSLVEEGRYAEAAKAAKAAGKFAQATELLERIWDFAAAATCAELAEDFPRALTNAIEARDPERIDEYATTLEAQGDDGRKQALEIFAKHRRFGRAARLAEGLGLLDDAIEYYQEGHLDLDAARLLAKVGRERDAGRILERAVRNRDPGLERSRANLQLGLILAKLMQHEDAVRCLQDAATQPECRVQALGALVIELAALGLRDGARDTLMSLRREDGKTTADLDVYIRDNRGKVVAKTGSKAIRVIGGRYRLETLLGSGGSGRVFRAHDEVSDKTVAIKLLATTHARGDDAYVRFSREAKVASNLRHPNLVEVYDFSADLGFLVMELMVGGSLEKKLKAGIKPRAARRMCLDILTGLELAHQRSIIHRDLKPANIFFDARGTAKLGDFGVAHLLDLGQTQTGGLIGTLAYMSPEQITGAPLTIAADLYGVGITLFEAITGRLPFQGPDFVAQHLGEVAPLPSEVSQASPLWDPLMARLLAKNPGERYGSIGELRRDLQALDLDDEIQPLLIPRPAHLRTSSNVRIPVQPPAEEEKKSESRYAFETTIGSTSRSKLSRAIDTTLDRSVIIERYESPLGEGEERRMYALARGGGPFLQRALSYERSKKVAIFEAPSGAPIGELAQPMSTRLAARLLMRLARAVAPLHAHDRAHGGLSGTTVLLDDRGHPTVLVCGLEPLPEEPVALADIRAILDIVSSTIETELDTEEQGGAAEGDEQAANRLICGLLGVVAPEHSSTLLQLPLTDGEELYTFAHTLELILLESKQRGVV